MATRIRFAAALAAFSWMALACASSMKVSATFDSGVDFSKYRTFGFNPTRQLDDTARQKLAERTINDILGPKGFRFDPAKPDLVIGLTPFLDPEIKGDSVPAGMVAWSTWGPTVGANISSGGHTSQAAQFTISFKDAATGHLVWRGLAEGRASLDDPSVTEKRIVEGLQRLLEQFPPEKK
jgi:hypothetical protein